MGVQIDRMNKFRDDFVAEQSIQKGLVKQVYYQGGVVRERETGIKKGLRK